MIKPGIGVRHTDNAWCALSAAPIMPADVDHSRFSGGALCSPAGSTWARACRVSRPAAKACFPLSDGLSATSSAAGSSRQIHTAGDEMPPTVAMVTPAWRRHPITAALLLLHRRRALSLNKGPSSGPSSRPGLNQRAEIEVIEGAECLEKLSSQKLSVKV